MEFKEVLFKINDHIAVLTLNRPEIRNAISSRGIIEEIETACRMVNDDMTVKVLNNTPFLYEK